MISQLKFVSIPVSDQDRALAFYRDKLGFRVKTDQPFDGSQRWIELRIPGAETGVVLFTPPGEEARVAVWGWSGGGSTTLNLMFRYPDLFRAGISVAPVPDQLLYDTIYQERYMGLPQDNAAGYRSGSPIHFAEALAGRLLLVHGSGDDNVHFQGTERLINRLIELGKPFDFLDYPNRTHAISEGEGTSLHLHRMLARFLIEHVPPGGK